jgi:glutaredoxin 3
MQAEVYSRDKCPFCIKAKMLLTQRGVEITETMLDEDNKSVLIERVVTATGAEPRTVPQIFIDGEYVGGYTDLVRHFTALDSEDSDGA